jgi:hypothetical protein
MAAQSGSSSTTSSDLTSLIHINGTAEIKASGSRPMEQAMTAIGQEYGIVVNYEDPIYQDADLVDDTDPKWRAGHPEEKSVTRPRGGAFSDSYTDNLATPSQYPNLLQKIVADYNQKGSLVRFKVVADHASQFSVFPESGTPLDSPVELPAGVLTIADEVSALSDAVSRSSGIRVVVGMIPIGLARQTTHQEDGKPMTARIKLARILGSSEIPLTWRLLYDADSNQYFLNYSGARQSWTNANGDKNARPLRQH